MKRQHIKEYIVVIIVIIIVVVVRPDITALVDKAQKHQFTMLLLFLLMKEEEKSRKSCLNCIRFMVPHNPSSHLKDRSELRQ